MKKPQSGLPPAGLFSSQPDPSIPGWGDQKVHGQPRDQPSGVDPSPAPPGEPLARLSLSNPRNTHTMPQGPAVGGGGWVGLVLPHLDGGRGLCFPAPWTLRATWMHPLNGLPDHAALELPQEVPDLGKRGGGQMSLLYAQGWGEKPKPTACPRTGTAP